MVPASRLACLAAGLWIAATAAHAAAVGFVTDLRGDARTASGTKIAFLGEVQPDTRVVLEAGARLTVIYIASGTEFTASGPGEFVFGNDEAKAVRGAAPTRRTVPSRPDAVVVTRVANSATASVRMRSANPAPPPSGRPALLYPRNVPVATLRPTLSWAAEPSASGFTVVVANADGKPAWKGSSKSNSARVGARLAPASRYTWTLAAGETTLGEASFETLPEAAIKRVEASRAAARSFSDRILHAFVLQDVGATQDARQAWADLARDRPDLPELAVLARQP